MNVPEVKLERLAEQGHVETSLLEQMPLPLDRTKSQRRKRDENRGLRQPKSSETNELSSLSSKPKMLKSETKTKSSSKKKKKAARSGGLTLEPPKNNHSGQVSSKAALELSEESINLTKEKLSAWKRHRQKLNRQNRSSGHSKHQSNSDSRNSRESAVIHKPNHSRPKTSRSRHRTRHADVEDDLTSGRPHRHRKRRSGSSSPPEDSKLPYDNQVKKQQARVSSPNDNEDHDSISVDSDETPVIKPADAGARSNSIGHWRAQDSNSSLSSQDCDQQDSKLEATSRRKASKGNHPPTDLEFALEMDSAARKLKRIAKDQEEAVVRKQVDYDQLRELLDSYTKDPSNADQERLNQLLDAMGESASEVGTEGVCSTTNTSLMPASSSQDHSLTDYLYESLDDHFNSSLNAAEVESIIAALGLAAGDNAHEESMDVHNDEIMRLHCQEQDLVESLSNSQKKIHSSRKLSAEGSHVSSKESVSARRLSHASAASSSSNMSRDKERHLSIDMTEDNSTSFQARTANRARLEMHKHDVLEVFGQHVDTTEFANAPPSPARLASLGVHKQEVLQVFGVQVRAEENEEEFVAIPLKPAVLTRAREPEETKVPAFQESNAKVTSRRTNEPENSTVCKIAEANEGKKPRTDEQLVNTDEHVCPEATLSADTPIDDKKKVKAHLRTIAKRLKRKKQKGDATK